MDFDRVIDNRHCSRKFKQTKKPDYRELIKAIETASKGPMAGNIPSLKFILVSDKKIIEELAKAANQDFISEVGYVIVVCSDKKSLERYFYERAKIYSRQQAGAAIQNILLKLTDLKLNSCWIGAFSDVTVKRILKIPEEVDVEAMLPVGYELGEQNKKRRKPALDRCLYFDTYKNRFMKQRREPGEE